MSLYQCEKCGVIENTACGWYHYTRNAGPEFEGVKLCSECGPAVFNNGSPTGLGNWHGRFEKRYFPVGTMETDEQGNIREKKK